MNQRLHHRSFFFHPAPWFADTGTVTPLPPYSPQVRFRNLCLAFSRESTWDHKIYWMLVLACAFCFIGHGAWGIIQKEAWLTFFRPFGFPDHVSYVIMPLIGIMDISMGLMILFWPTRALLLWMAIWCLWTAHLRPIAGLGYWEVFERGGDYFAPIVLVFVMAWSKSKSGDITTSSA